jgi:hypothetical protein
LRHAPINALKQIAELRGAIITTPSAGNGHKKRPRSSRLA